MNRRQFCGSSLAAAIVAALPAGSAYGAFRALTQVTSSIAAVTGRGTEVTLEKAAIQELKDSLRGNLLLSGSEGYDIARRVLNPAFDKHPALIVQPTGAADISNAVTFAQERDLLLAVKCGGHSFSGKSTCEGGMQIDLSTFRHVRVDPDRRIARVSGGSLLGGVDHECLAHGLVTPTGTVSHTGVGGLATGGGFGRVARRFGLTLDNIRAVDMVTADGELRHASADENPELYWGVRGGGGNFGVVTSFEFGLHPLDRTVIAGNITFPLARAKDILPFYADFSQEAPDELYLDLVLAAPPGGKPAVVLMQACWSGDHNEAARVLASLEKLGKPLVNSIGPVDYVAFQRSGDNSDPRHGGDYLKGGFVTEISDGFNRAIAEGFEAHPDRSTVFYFQQSGGAIGRVPADATAFVHRDAISCPGIIVSWNKDADPTPHIDYIREYWAGLEKYSKGYYFNVTDNEPQPVANLNYGSNFDRLVALKNKYDPTNLFRLNANIEATV